MQETNSEFNLVQAISVNSLPAITRAPRLPVRNHLGRDGLLQLLLQPAGVFLSRGSDDPRQPRADVEVGFARGGAGDETRVGEVGREVVEYEFAEVLPVLRGGFVELLLCFRGGFVGVDGEEAAVAFDLGLVEIAVCSGFWRLGVLLQSVLA